MEDQTNNRIKEEFEKEFGYVDEDHKWWLSKLDSLLKTQREELVEKLEEYKLNYNPIGNDINKGRRLACDDILYLIK